MAAIKVDGLGKKFQIGHQVSGDFRNSFASKIKNLFRKSNMATEDFWALRDMSFEIQKGEAVGIIGRNGAGKSTLLKILSRITDPTTGRFEINGRVSSLLEVGTGFHPELTGRENIYLNGTILGMKRREIKAKFDEIVAFSGVEKFIDTAVKHYSSGMKVRLAFSVAAHLEPEILIIDEVLAVGDAEFQRKCLGKMEQVSQEEGRTILFVSHDMTAVTNLCRRTILLKDGGIQYDGLSPEVINIYNNSGDALAEVNSNLRMIKNRQGTGKIIFHSIAVKSIENTPILLGDSIEFSIQLYADEIEESKPIHLAITIFNERGIKLATLDNLYTGQKIRAAKGITSVICEVPKLNLLPGKYAIDLWCADEYETYDMVDNVLQFEIEPQDIFGTGKVHNYHKHGNILIENRWSNFN